MPTSLAALGSLGDPGSFRNYPSARMRLHQNVLSKTMKLTLLSEARWFGLLQDQGSKTLEERVPEVIGSGWDGTGNARARPVAGGSAPGTGCGWGSLTSLQQTESLLGICWQGLGS